MKLSIKKIIIMSVCLALFFSFPVSPFSYFDFEDTTNIMIFLVGIMCTALPIITVFLYVGKAPFEDIMAKNCGVSKKVIYDIRRKEVFYTTIISFVLTLISLFVQTFFIHNNSLFPTSNDLISIVPTTVCMSLYTYALINCYMRFGGAPKPKFSMSGLFVVFFPLTALPMVYHRHYALVIFIAVISLLVIILKKPEID